MSELAIKLSGVHRTFDKGLVQALRGVDLEIAKGESIAIVGQSGSGKSTLLNMIGALDFPDQGEVFLFGQKITADLDLDQVRNRRLGFIFQLHHLIPNLTVLENVELALKPRKLSKAERSERSKELLIKVGLEHRMDFLPVKISGGERQRAAVARALVTDPDLILGDEPTGSLDSTTGRSLMSLIEELSVGQGKSLVVVTHNEEFASRLSRTVKITDGLIEV
ncbi:MAG: ABC transporter ATP-binding protein [Bdellovibrionota bacterium]